MFHAHYDFMSYRRSEGDMRERQARIPKTRQGDSNAGPRDYETLQADLENLRDILKAFDLEEDTLP